MRPLMIMTAIFWIAASSTASPMKRESSVPSPKEVAELAEALGAAGFEERETATKRLIELGYYARPAVRKALNSDDPEVSERARKIWRLIHWAVFPEAKLDICRFVSRLESGDPSVPDEKWSHFAVEYGAALLPLATEMLRHPKTKAYATRCLIAVLEAVPADEVASAVASSESKRKIERALSSMKPKSLSKRARDSLFSVLEKLGMNYAIVDLTASLWRSRRTPNIPAPAEKLLSDEKSAESIYEKALQSFNNSAPSLDNDWKLCFYCEDAARRGRSKLLAIFFKNLDYHPTRKRVLEFVAEKLLKTNLPKLALEQLSGSWSLTATYLRERAAKLMKDADKAEKLRKLLMSKIGESRSSAFEVAGIAAGFQDPLATELYKKLLESKNLDIYSLNAALRLAATAEKAGNYEKAKVFYEKALNHKKIVAAGVKVAGLPLKDYLSRRIALMDAVLKGGASNWTNGLKAMKRKEYGKALEFFGAFVERNPDFAFARSNKAVALERLGRGDEALKELEAAVNAPVGASEEFRIRCVHRQAEILQKTKRYSDAVKLLEQAVKKHEKAPSLYSALGFNAYFAGEYGKSAAALKMYRKLKPDDIYSALWRFNALRLMGLNPEQAFAAFAEKLKTRRWPAAVVAFQNGKLSAGKCLEAAESSDVKRRNEMRCEAYFYIGEDLFIKGRKSEAAKYYRKCLECDIPEFLETKEAEIRLRQLEKQEDGQHRLVSPHGKKSNR